jgi:prepilin peptidase CpaA
VNPTEIPETIAIAWLLPFLATAIATDMWHRRIPNALVVVMLISALALHATSLELASVLWSLGGVLVGLLILLPFYALGGMGAGDVKLLAAVGSLLGPWSTLLAGVLTLIAGALLGLGMMAWRSAGALPIAHRLPVPRAAATEPLQVPYSIAIAAGALIAVLQW